MTIRTRYRLAGAIAVVGIGIFLSEHARAADLAPVAVEPVDVVTPYNWTGPYVGIHGGYIHTSAKTRDTNGGVNPGPFSYSGNSAFGGVQAGYNYQFAVPVVVGLEGDIGYMGSNAKGIIGSANAASHQNLTIKSGWYGDVTARLGYSIDLGNGSAILIYGKGGYAYSDLETKQQTTNPGYVATSAKGRSGWTAGGGVEYAINQNWSVKVEYLHYDFGEKGGYQTNVGDESSPIGYQFHNKTKLTAETVKVGLNYRF